MDKPWGVQLPDALPFEIKLELSLYHVGSNTAVLVKLCEIFWRCGAYRPIQSLLFQFIEEYWKGQTLRGGRVLRRSELRLSL